MILWSDASHLPNLTLVDPLILIQTMESNSERLSAFSMCSLPIFYYHRSSCRGSRGSAPLVAWHRLIKSYRHAPSHRGSDLLLFVLDVAVDLGQDEPRCHEAGERGQ